MASSHGELTLVFDTRTLRQQSISMPSRFVSMVRLSMVKLSTPVARIPKCPPCRIAKSRSVTFRQFLRLMALLPTPAVFGARPFGQTFAVNESRPENLNVRKILAPDQTIVPVTMPEILKLVRDGFGSAASYGAAGAADPPQESSRHSPATAKLYS